MIILLPIASGLKDRFHAPAGVPPVPFRNRPRWDPRGPCSRHASVRKVILRAAEFAVAAGLGTDRAKAEGLRSKLKRQAMRGYHLPGCTVASGCLRAWIRRYPHDSFSRASRSTTNRTVRRTGGRPERPRRDNRAHRRRTMPRCQRKIVARGYDQPQPGQALGRQHPGEQRQPRPVRPRQPRMSPRSLTQGHRQLMTQHRDLGVLPNGGELGVTVPDEKSERTDPVTKIHQQVPRLLRRPRAVRVPGHTEDVHPPGRHLHDEQDIQALEEDRIDGEEVTRQQALRLDAEELSPGRIHAARSGPVPPGAQDPPDRRVADLVAEPGQFAVYAPISPPRVLPCQLQRQVSDLPADRWPTPPVRVGPFPGDQAAMPGQQRSRRHQTAPAERAGQQPGQRCQDRPVGPARPGPGHLTAQHHHLVPQH